MSLHAGLHAELIARQSEDLLEEIGGGLCICQRADVPHWCEGCQRKLQLIREAISRAVDTEQRAAFDWAWTDGYLAGQHNDEGGAYQGPEQYRSYQQSRRGEKP